MGRRRLIERQDKHMTALRQWDLKAVIGVPIYVGFTQKNTMDISQRGKKSISRLPCRVFGLLNSRETKNNQ